MKKYLFIAAILVVNNIAFAAAYQPNDVNTFITTGKCPNGDLSMTDLTGSMYQMMQKTQNQNFYEGVNLQNANAVGTSFGSSVGFNMQNSDFDGLSGSKSYFLSDQLDGSTFINAILESANFVGANLSDVDFTGADLKGANFSGANLYQAKITSAQLSETTNCNTVMPNGAISTSCSGKN